MATLEARRLQMRFGDRVVLEDISLTFHDREFSGIMGPNGAGKTTSFNVLTGRYRPTRGQVLLDGEDITGLPPRAIARKGVSRSFQLLNLFNDFTALENVALAVPESRRHGLSMLRHAAREGIATDKAAKTLARAGVGWVPDDRRLCPTLTVARNLAIARKASPYRAWTLGEIFSLFSALE